MRRFRTAALLVAALVAGLSSNAMAAPGDAPAGWTLVGSDTVRYFLPGTTPPAGADLADAVTATQISSQNPSSGEWLQVSSETVKDFLPDGSESSSDQLISSTFVTSRNEQQVYSVGQQKLTGEPTYDPSVWESDTKKWRLVSQTATVRRYDVPVYQNVHTPYRIVDRFGYDTRTVDTYDNTYRANKTVKTALGEELVDTHTYTKREEKASPWVRGGVEPALDKLVSEGIDDTVKTTTQAYVVDLLAGKVAESDKTQGAKSSTFLSDSGSGNSKTALSGSKKRVAFKADQAVASLSKTADKGGSILDPKDNGKGKDENKGKDEDKDNDENKGKGNGDPLGTGNDPAPGPSGNGNSSLSLSSASSVASERSNALSAAALVAVDPVDALVGTWRLKGGSASFFTVARDGKSSNIKVHFELKSIFGTFTKEFTTPYSTSWSTSKDGVTTSAKVSADSRSIVVTTKFLKATVSSTFVKQ